MFGEAARPKPSHRPIRLCRPRKSSKADLLRVLRIAVLARIDWKKRVPFCFIFVFRRNRCSLINQDEEGPSRTVNSLSCMLLIVFTQPTTATARLSCTPFRFYTMPFTFGAFSKDLFFNETSESRNLIGILINPCVSASRQQKFRPKFTL